MACIIYTIPFDSTFIRQDEEILKSSFEIINFQFRQKRKIEAVFSIIKQFGFLIIKYRKASLFITQFSGHHSFLPSLFTYLFGKKHFIIVHGADCNNFPEYNYGYIRKPFLFLLSKLSLKMATGILPVSHALVKDHYDYTTAVYKEQGLLSFYKNINSSIEVISNGIDPTKFQLKNIGIRKKNSFVTVVANCDSIQLMQLKGIDLIFEMAKRKSNCNFYIIGNFSVKIEIPENVILLNYIANEKLHEIYNQMEYYIQLSVIEGFGISVCEAMLCGCIPIVSKVGILPEITSGVGYVLLKKDITALDKILDECVNHEVSVDDRKKCRANIVDNYTLQIRKEKLIDLVKRNINE